jgi:hypothetical protein
MKKLLVPLAVCIFATTLLTGCLSLEFGSGSVTRNQHPTVGQQLIDLQKAKDSGAINEAEYQTEKAKILEGK